MSNTVDQMNVVRPYKSATNNTRRGRRYPYVGCSDKPLPLQSWIEVDNCSIGVDRSTDHPPANSPRSHTPPEVYLDRGRDAKDQHVQQCVLTSP
uniref:Uncharacterized protein n=1 Tax=Knipowitschia caucasica TaxID=637954 RepID=A0AAV2LYL6_KNICA